MHIFSLAYSARSGQRVGVCRSIGRRGCKMRGKPLTEEERHDKAQQSAVIHLDISGAHEPMRSACGLSKPGGLSWFGEEGEFDDRPSYRCKRCEKIWLRDQEADMDEARWQSTPIGEEVQ